MLVALAADPCERCHEDEAAAFARSRHAQARVLPVFARSFRETRNPWCLGCHQPEGEGDGLACLSCHRVDGQPDAVLSTHATPAGRTSHPVVIARDLETSACARCHQFNAPLPGHLEPVVLSSEPLQSTVRELHDASTCSACHEPHAALGGHDAALLAEALSIRAARTDAGVRFELRAGRTGHRFPTGDPFRRVVLETCRDAACTDVVARKTLQRAMGERDGAWKTLRDDTLAPGERRVVTLEAGAWWQVRYLFGDARFEPELPPGEVGLRLAGGAVP